MTIHEYIIKNWNNYSSDSKSYIIRNAINRYETIPSVSRYKCDIENDLPYININNEIKITKVQPHKHGYGTTVSEKGKILSVSNYSYGERQKRTVYVLHIGLSEKECLDMVIERLNLKTVEEIKIENL